MGEVGVYAQKVQVEIQRWNRQRAAGVAAKPRG
jgi:hypothetical protein